MNHSFDHFGVIGAGAWGTALAAALCRAGRRVTLWAHEPDIAATINRQHENVVYLKGIALDTAIKATSNLQDLSSCDALIFACPAQHIRTLMQQTASLLDATSHRPIIIAAKGIELDTAALLSEIATAVLPDSPLAILSGPSFAAEVARGLPTALTLACADQKLAAALLPVMASSSLRLYQSDDIIGAEIGGAIKNVLAVACGIVTGRKFGDNARAALITRGLAEMLRLSLALGARTETLMGLSGLGDLVLTCSSPQSRNMSLGIALGEGQKLEDILAARRSVTEGVTTATAALTRAARHNIDMPITAAVANILGGKADINSVITGLMMRPLKVETL